MSVASGSHRAVKGNCVGILLATSALKHGGEVGAAAEPGFRRDDIARVHMGRRHMGIMRMGDQRNAAGIKPRIVGGAGDFIAEFRGEFAKHRRNVDAALFEHAPLHHCHHAAA